MYYVVSKFKKNNQIFWSGSWFSSYGPNWAQNGPKLETEEFCNILGRPFIFLGNVDLPKAQKVVVSFLHFIRPIWRRGVSSLTATETLKQGHRLFSVILMLRGSSAHSVNDRHSLFISCIVILVIYRSVLTILSILNWQQILG